MKETETHLSVEDLAAYQAGELAEDAEARVQDHLMGCPECTRMLLDLAALREGADPDDEAPRSEKDAFWQALQPRLAAAEAAEAPAPPAPLPFPAPRETPDRSRRLRMFQLLAATLAAAVVGLAVQNAGLRRTVDDLSRPGLGAPVRDLSATPARGGAAPSVIPLEPDDRFFTLVLSPADPRDFPDYEVVIEKSEGGEVWRGQGLQKNALGTFSLVLARRLTGEGDFTLRVFGIEGEEKQIAGEYRFRIEMRSGP